MILTMLVAAQLMQPKVDGVELGQVPVTQMVNPQCTFNPQAAPQVHGPYKLTVPAQQAENELKWSDVLKDINNESLRWDN